MRKTRLAPSFTSVARQPTPEALSKLIEDVNYNRPRTTPLPPPTDRVGCSLSLSQQAKLNDLHKASP